MTAKTLSDLNSIECDNFPPFTCDSSRTSRVLDIPREHATKFMAHFDEWHKGVGSFVLIFSQCAMWLMALFACKERNRLQVSGFDASQINTFKNACRT